MLSTACPISATIPGHGTYTCSPGALDLAMIQHLPASAADLPALAEAMGATVLIDATTDVYGVTVR